MFSEIKQTIYEFQPSRGQLRGFGIVLGLITALSYVFFHQLPVLLLLFTIALILAFFFPIAYLPITKVLIGVTYPIGWLLSRVLLTLLFFLVITPIGLMRRVFLLILGRQMEKNQSYWQDVEQNSRHDRMTL